MSIKPRGGQQVRLNRGQPTNHQLDLSTLNIPHLCVFSASGLEICRSSGRCECIAELLWRGNKNKNVSPSYHCQYLQGWFISDSALLRQTVCSMLGRKNVMRGMLLRVQRNISSMTCLHLEREIDAEHIQHLAVETSVRHMQEQHI